MNLLLDTCALLALAQGALPAKSSKALRKAPKAIVSPIVPWEIAIKVRSGKLDLPLPPLKWVGALVVRHELDGPTGGLDAELLCAAADLPFVHRDPFDRVLVATALRHDLVIITSDRFISGYPGIRTLW
jgi:PIN domain nuclease of toxin-antitoxin system